MRGMWQGSQSPISHLFWQSPIFHLFKGPISQHFLGSNSHLPPIFDTETPLLLIEILIPLLSHKLIPSKAVLIPLLSQQSVGLIKVGLAE